MFIGQMDVGDPTYNLVTKSIELFVKEVKPIIKNL